MSDPLECIHRITLGVRRATKITNDIADEIDAGTYHFNERSWDQAAAAHRRAAALCDQKAESLRRVADEMVSLGEQMREVDS